MKEDTVPIYYLYLHSKIWESKGSFVSEKELKDYLFQWKIPNKMRILLIKELISMGLLEKDSRYNLKINRPDFTLEDLNSYYVRYGLF